MKIVGAASDNHRIMMSTLCEFCGAESIKYKDLGNGEDYTLEKDGNKILIKARGGKFDGGFLVIEKVEKS